MSAVEVKMTVTEKGVGVVFENCEIPKSLFFNGELRDDIEGLKSLMNFIAMYCARRKFVFEEEFSQDRTSVLEKIESSESTPQGEEITTKELLDEKPKESHGKKSGKKANKKGSN